MAETKGSVWDPSERVRQNIDREVDGVIQCVFRGHALLSIVLSLIL